MARLGAPSVTFGIMATHALDRELDRIAPIVRECVDPRRIVLFGSRARSAVDDASDWDIYVEVDDDSARREMETRVRKALRDARIAADVFVCSKRRFDERRDDPGAVEWDVDRQGLLLYARPGVTAARVYERPASHGSIADWLANADEDFRIMDMALAAESYPAGPVAFHAHAGAEKLLKALIVSSGRRPRRTHALSDLLKQCPPELEARLADAATLLDAMFPRTEYPELGRVSPEEAKAAVAAARLLRGVARPIVAGPTTTT